MTAPLPLITFTNAMGKEEIQLLPAIPGTEVASQITNYNLCTLFRFANARVTSSTGPAIEPSGEFGQFPEITVANAGQTFVVTGDALKEITEPAKARDRNDRLTAARMRKLKDISQQQRDAAPAWKAVAPPQEVAAQSSSAHTPAEVQSPPREAKPAPTFAPVADIPHTCKRCGQVMASTSRDLHEAKCALLKDVCPTCGMCVEKALMADHVATTHAVTVCRCGAKVVITAIAAHNESQCPLRERSCRYCDLAVTVKDMASHESRCGDKTEPCDWCNQRVCQRDAKTHRCPRPAPAPVVAPPRPTPVPVPPVVVAPKPVVHNVAPIPLTRRVSPPAPVVSTKKVSPPPTASAKRQQVTAPSVVAKKATVPAPLSSADRAVVERLQRRDETQMSDEALARMMMEDDRMEREREDAMFARMMAEGGDTPTQNRHGGGGMGMTDEEMARQLHEQFMREDR